MISACLYVSPPTRLLFRIQFYFMKRGGGYSEEIKCIIIYNMFLDYTIGY